jgi:GT2 family glycosyltransferase
MKVGFVFTNYNNSLLTVQAINSIETNKSDCACSIVIIDNCSTDIERDILFNNILSSSVKVVFNKINIGYFPGLNLGIDELIKNHFDFDLIVIGNNDLVFDRSFFQSISDNYLKIKEFPVVCPSIVTIDGFYQNPHVYKNISRFREIIWDIYYSNYYFSLLILRIASLFRFFVQRKDFKSFSVNGFIDQGYGACYLLTPKFFLKYTKLWAPSFLMGEEFHLSRQLKSLGDKMFYFSEITVFHHDHATISKVSNRLLWDYSKRAHSIYRFFVSPYRIKMDNDRLFSDFNAMLD